MKVLLNTDRNVEGSTGLVERVEAELAGALERFENRLTRVEVHLSDESARRTTSDDFRCLLEARPSGAEPVAVTAHGATLDEAVAGATDKLVTLLTTTFDRLETQEARATIRGR